jgi:hypothetical protein
VSFIQVCESRAGPDAIPDDDDGPPEQADAAKTIIKISNFFIAVTSGKPIALPYGAQTSASQPFSLSNSATTTRNGWNVIYHPHGYIIGQFANKWAPGWHKMLDRSPWPLRLRYAWPPFCFKHLAL